MNIQKKNVGIILFITGFIILSENSGLIFNNLLLKDNTKEDLDIKPAYIPLLPWENNGTVICNADYDQNSPVMCSDGAGGVIIAWRDYRNGSNWDIYAQRFSSAGRAMWDPNGIPICTDYYHQYDPQICSDGSGGAIIAWRDKRGLDDIYAQKITSTGEVLWAANGTQLLASNYGQQFGEYFQICSNGAGGAFLVFSYGSQYNYYDVYVQKLNTIGETQWGTLGKPVCNLFMDQMYPQILADGFGGAFITWIDQRVSGNYLYGQRIDSIGNMLWTANGSTVIGSRNCYAYQICSDGENGVLISAHVLKSGQWDIVVQKLNSTGDRQWGNGGLNICIDPTHQTYTSVCNDGLGGAIVVWQDSRNGAVSGWDIYGQRINSSGIIKWTPDGTALCVSENHQERPRICSDGEGGAIIAWNDDRGGGIRYRDIYGQHIAPDGNPLWNINGKPISEAQDAQTNPIIHSGINGEAFVVWWDNRSLANWDIYLQYLKKDLEPPIISINSPYPGDKFGKNPPAFNLSITEWDLDSIWYTMDNGLTNTTTTFINQIDLTLWNSLGNGTINLIFYANDSVGNVGSKEIKILKDILPPIISIHNPSLGEEFIEFPPIFNVSFNENDIDSTWYTIDNGITNFTFSGLTGAINNNVWFSMPDGPVTIQFFANDSIGNIGFEQITVVKNAYPLSLPSISINSPDNIIYGAPMSGYYLSSYGFENDQDGEIPEGWQDYSGAHPIITEVISEFNGHKKVVRGYDGGTGAFNLQNIINKSYGTVEWWWAINIAGAKSIQICFFDSNSQIICGVMMENFNLRFWNSTGWITYVSTPTNDNTWYHCRIDFEQTSGGYMGLQQGTYRCYFNETDCGRYLVGNLNEVNFLRFYSGYPESDVYGYLDAVGYSWDPNYDIGDNLNNGLLLSFTSKYQLEWIAYSLDGQQNVTILGDTVIKLPGDGLHGIQVFGNVSTGKVFHSDIKYFVINRFLYILNLEIIDLSLSSESFNLTFYIYNETYYGIDFSVIQIWWNGSDVSSDLLNLGSGLYFISLKPIIVFPGENPILLRLIISAEGYEDKYFEIYIAVDPDALDKSVERSVEYFSFMLPIIIISSITAGIGGIGVILLLLRKRKSINEVI